MGRRWAALVVGVACALGGLVAVPAAPASAAAVAGSPVGSFDWVGLSFDPGARLTGWAADPSAPGQPVQIRLYVNGGYVGATTTGVGRADIAKKLPWAGTKSGWDTVLLGSPTQTACAYAINVGPGANTSLGCHKLGSFGPDAAHSPIGTVEKMVASPGLVRVAGWAGDPDDRTRTRTARVRVMLDGGEAAIVRANLPRPDVQAVTKLNGTTGFDINMPVLPGRHSLCIVIENTGPGTWFPTVGCAWKDVPGVPAAGAHDPRGYLEDRGASFGDPSHWSAWGWAYDPDTSGPVSVLVRSLGYGIDGRVGSRTISRSLSTGVPRPDVEVDEPGAGPNAGFHGELAVTIEGQLTYSCFYVTNVGAGRNRFIGCSSTRVILDAVEP